MIFHWIFIISNSSFDDFELSNLWACSKDVKRTPFWVLSYFNSSIIDYCRIFLFLASFSSKNWWYFKFFSFYFSLCLNFILASSFNPFSFSERNSNSDCFSANSYSNKCLKRYSLLSMFKSVFIGSLNCFREFVTLVLNNCCFKCLYCSLCWCRLSYFTLRAEFKSLLFFLIHSASSKSCSWDSIILLFLRASIWFNLLLSDY